MHDPSPVHRPLPAHACRCGIRDEPSCGSFPLRHFSVERHPVDGGVARQRPRPCADTEWRSSLAPGRGLVGLPAGRSRGQGRYLAGGTGGQALDKAWRPLCAEHDLGLHRPPRHDRQKKQRTPASRLGPTSRHGARRGSRASLTSIRHAWSSSMRLPSLRRWPGCADGRNAARAAGCRCRTGIGTRRRLSAACAFRA